MALHAESGNVSREFPFGQWHSFARSSGPYLVSDEALLPPEQDRGAAQAREQHQERPDDGGDDADGDPSPSLRVRDTLPRGGHAERVALDAVARRSPGEVGGGGGGI